MCLTDELAGDEPDAPWGGRAASPGGLTRGAAHTWSDLHTLPWAGRLCQQPHERVTAVTQPGKPQLDPVVPNLPEPSSAFRIFVNDVDCPITLKNDRSRGMWGGSCYDFPTCVHGVLAAASSPGMVWGPSPVPHTGGRSFNHEKQITWFV